MNNLIIGWALIQFSPYYCYDEIINVHVNTLYLDPQQTPHLLSSTYSSIINGWVHYSHHRHCLGVELGSSVLREEDGCWAMGGGGGGGGREREGDGVRGGNQDTALSLVPSGILKGSLFLKLLKSHKS